MKYKIEWVYRLTVTIWAFRRLRQEDSWKFESSLVYIARSSLSYWVSQKFKTKDIAINTKALQIISKWIKRKILKVQYLNRKENTFSGCFLLNLVLNSLERRAARTTLSLMSGMGQALTKTKLCSQSPRQADGHAVLSVHRFLLSRTAGFIFSMEHDPLGLD